MTRFTDKTQTQAQVDIPLKYRESEALCRKNEWLVQNHGPGKPNDKICADSMYYQKYNQIHITTKPKTFQNQFKICIYIWYGT